MLPLILDTDSVLQASGFTRRLLRCAAGRHRPALFVLARPSLAIEEPSLGAGLSGVEGASAHASVTRTAVCVPAAMDLRFVHNMPCRRTHAKPEQGRPCL